MKKLGPKPRAFIQKWVPLVVSPIIFAGHRCHLLIG